MKEKLNEFIAWIKLHRKELFIAGISLTSIIGVIIGLKYKDAIMEFWDSLKRSITNVPEKMPESSSVPQIADLKLEEVKSDRIDKLSKTVYVVSQHIRILPDGKHHSASKAEEALELGISLSPNQTIVDSYTKGAAA